MVCRRNAKTWAVIVGLFTIATSSTTLAEERPVLRRLKTYGDLSDDDAHVIIEKISQRMKVAADLSNSSDPLRVAVSTALYDSATPSEPSATSMVRLRLYAGLTEWALDHVFSSRRAVSEICSGSGLQALECRALLAAAQSVPVDDVSPLRIRVASAVADDANTAPPQPAAATTRWPRPSAASNTPAADTASAGLPTPRRAATANLAAPPQRTAAAVAQRKADYAAQRQAYLERRRTEMETRKAKLLANAGGERAKRGPASQEEAEVVGLGRTASAPPAAAAQAQEDPDMVASRGAKRSGSEKAADDLFEGLMENPLGKR
jgi:hypothetical protein